MIINLRYGTYDCKIKLGTYGNGRLAIQLLDINDEIPVCKCTVNLPGDPCEIGHCYIKDYSENEGIFNELIRHGIIEQSLSDSKRSTTGIEYVRFVSSESKLETPEICSIFEAEVMEINEGIVSLFRISDKIGDEYQVQVAGCLNVPSPDKKLIYDNFFRGSKESINITGYKFKSYINNPT